MTTEQTSESAETPVLSARQLRGRARAARRAAKRDATLTPPPEDAWSGGQIRTARRVALRHGVVAETDADLIRALEAKGIDPFSPANMLQLVGKDTSDPVSDGPVIVVAAKNETLEDAEEKIRALELVAVQRDIARRRRRVMLAFVARLLVFVLVPTALAGAYFARVATPLYAVHAEFLVQKAGAASGGLGALLSGTALGSSQEAVAVQHYLGSKDAYARLNAEEGYVAVFSGDDIDPLLRLPEDASVEQGHRHYKRRVKLGYDPTEGVVKLDVKAPDPETAMRFSTALIAYAEQVVDTLSLRQRDDQVAQAEAAYAEARDAMLAAQKDLVALQQEKGLLNGESEATLLMSQLASFEAQLREARMERAALQDNAAPHPAKIAAKENRIMHLEQVVAAIRADLTNPGDTPGSLPEASAALAAAETDLATRTLLLQQAVQQLEAARAEANRRHGYLALNVAPVAPQAASSPKVVENTLLAFLVFAGIYLFVSLTAAVLKEQVSA